MNDLNKNSIDQSIAVKPISKRVFAKFLDVLAEDEEMQDIASRLKVLLLEKDILSEAAIKEALFPEPKL